MGWVALDEVVWEKPPFRLLEARRTGAGDAYRESEERVLFRELVVDSGLAGDLVSMPV